MRLLISIMLLSLACLQGCGVPSSGSASSGPTNPDDNNGFTTIESMKIRVETSAALEGVSVTNLTVVTLDENLQENNVSAPQRFRVENTGDNAYTVNFSALFDDQANVAVRASLDNGERLYAPLFSLPNNTEFIEVSIFSHLLVTRFFAAIETRDDLLALLPCDEGPEGDCLNQAAVKSQQLVNLYKMLLSYETNLVPSASVAQAVNQLEGEADLLLQIDLGIAEILRDTSPIAQGVKRAFSLTEGELLTQATKAKRYNANMFAISLNQENPDSSNNSVLLSSHLSHIIGAGELGDNRPSLPVYPQFLQTTTRFDIRRDILLSDIPFTTHSLRIKQADDYELALPVPINTLGSPLFDSFLSTQGNLLYARSLEQTIPGGAQDRKDIGWQFNPLFSRLYRVNDVELAIDPVNPPVDETELKLDPDWLLTSNYSSGTSYQLNEANNRQSRLQDLNLFSWELYSQETETDFDINALDGKTFGTVGFSLRLNQDSQAIEVFADLMQWRKSGTQIVETQPSDALNFFQSHKIQRDILGSASPLTTTQTANFPVRAIFQERTLRLSEEDSNVQVNEQRGLIVLDGGSKPSSGTATNDGRHLSFALDTDDRGQGFLLATEQRSAIPVFNDNRYQLQGNSVSLSNEANTLRNYAFSSLSIGTVFNGDNPTEACNAQLTLSTMELTQDVASNQLAEAVAVAESTPFNSSRCETNTSQIIIEFDQVQDKPLTLKGFVAREGTETEADQGPGKLINLILIHGDDTLGLLFGTLEQSLSPTFEEDG